jgi:hypothetical protein
MKSIVVASLIALAFTTGFTCSKNQPAENAATAGQAGSPTQEQMAAPAEQTGAPAEGAAAPTDGAPAAAPVEGTK